MIHPRLTFSGWKELATEQGSRTQAEDGGSLKCFLKVKVPHLCLTLCDLMDCTVHGILQARILEWVAFPFSRWSSWPRDQTCVSCISRRILYHWVSSAWAPSLASELETRDTHLVLLYQLDIQRAYRGCGDTRKGHLEPQLLGLAFCWRRRKVYSGAVRVWCNHTPDREEKPELMKRALIKDKTTCGPWLDGKMGLEQEYFHSCA